MFRYSQLVPFMDFRSDYGPDVIEAFWGTDQILEKYKIDTSLNWGISMHFAVWTKYKILARYHLALGYFAAFWGMDQIPAKY